jgi:hypothetical protein
MVPEIEILMPKATKNLILNPSFENNIAGWVAVPEGDGQVARFEWGNLVGYPDGLNNKTDANNQLSVQKRAALSGSLGMELAVDGSNTVAYGELTGPAGEKLIMAEFLLDLNDYTMNAGDNHAILFANFAGGSTFSVTLIENGGVIEIFINHVQDAGNTSSGQFAVPFPGVSKISLEWSGADNPGDNDGYVRFYIDDVQRYSALNLDNDTRSVDTLFFGAVSAPNANNTGSYFMDNLSWYQTVGNFVVAEPTLERARFGRKSLKLQTPGVANSEGVYRQIDTTGINGPVVGSAYLRGGGRVRLRLIDGATGGQYVSQEHQLHDRYWQRVSAEGITVGGNDYRMYIETIGTVPQEETIYVDGAQLEKGGVLTSYCDGDQEGCFWNGVFHASTSEREDTSMAGGEWVPFRDDECDPDSYYTEVSGFGMPPVTLNRQSMALTAGSFYDSTRIEERVLIINSFFRDRGAQKRKGNEIKHLFELRQRIEDLVKPDSNPNQDPFWLRFGQDGKWLYIQAHYETGMEFDFDVRNKWTNASSLRFIAMQPYFTEDSQETAVLDFGYELGDDLEYAMRVDGEWKVQLNGADNGNPVDAVWAIEFDQNDQLIFGGNFTQDDDGLDIRRLAVSNNDYTLLSQLGPGMLDGYIYDVAVHPNGKLYFCGTFTQDGDGNAYSLVAEYNPNSNSYDDLDGGTGADVSGHEVWDIEIAPSGNVYIGGVFATVGGAPAFHIAYWDGGAWHTVGNIDAEVNCDIIYKLVVISDDEIYAFGSDLGASSSGRVAWKWDGTNWSTIYTVPSDGTEDDSISRAATLGNDGSVYFGVNKDKGGAGNPNDAAQLFRYNGASAEQLGEDLIRDNVAGGPQIRSLAQDSDGLIYLSVFRVDMVGSLIVEAPLLIWNGSSFVISDLAGDFDSVASVGLAIRRNNDVYIGFSNSTDNVNVSSITNLNNIGTAQVFPIIDIEGPGKILWIENQTTKQIAFMNYTNQENELLEIDFRTGEKTVTSNYAGSVPDAILPNSEDILLAAGTFNEAKSNKFAVLIVDAVNPTVQLRYTPTHWSIDALDML